MDDLQILANGLKHRGPDGVGYFLCENVGLIHRRLSIIDVSEKANQPLYNEDKSLVLICNGEIYNHLTLRNELERKGHTFYCNSDSEVLLHLYEEHSERPDLMLEKVKGMFAFALFDKKSRKLLIARDRFGIKPLYYYKHKKDFFFASEIEPITLVYPNVKNNIDYTSLFEYFQYQAIPEPNTIYQNLKALPAGSFAVIHEQDFKISKWYNLADRIIQSHFTDYRDFSLQLISKIERSVQEHLISDVPLGSFLSAGIDSTIITHLAYKYGNSSFSAVSAGFPGEEEDESLIAKETAQKLGVPHFIFNLNGGFFNDIDEISQYFDQPFAVSSAFSLFRISKLARSKMKVVLTGDGGDEVFAGYGLKYEYCNIPRYVTLTPRFLRPFVGFLFSGFNYKAISRQFNFEIPERFLSRNQVIIADDALSFIPGEKRREVNQDRFLEEVKSIFSSVRHLPLLHQLRLMDVNTFLKSEMLYKVDRMTMANGIEARVPFLDHDLVEMAFSTPVNSLRKDGVGKLPLRDWVEVHYSGLGKRKKTGFNAPLRQFIKNDSDTRNQIHYLLNSARKSEMLEENMVNKSIASFNRNEQIDLSKIMTLTCLGAWAKKR